jgi:hypothetical protein
MGTSSRSLFTADALLGIIGRSFPNCIWPLFTADVRVCIICRSLPNCIWPTLLMTVLFMKSAVF